VVLKKDYKPMLEQIFSEPGFINPELPITLRLKGASRLSDLAWCYNLDFTGQDAELTLDEYCREKLSTEVVAGAEVIIGAIKLTVDEIVGNRITTVQLDTRLESD
jgi:cell volume regulation protein A